METEWTSVRRSCVRLENAHQEAATSVVMSTAVRGSMRSSKGRTLSVASSREIP